ncbi:MAG: LPS export ABC transporter periplasmic protein LptC [Rhizobiaceae bacterium]|nr:LPS export ABC transporter periplasmic protein LptC [Rhizobiaceae bacterium]
MAVSLAQATGTGSSGRPHAGGSSGRDRTEAFAHAQRHSRKVRLLKFVLPLLAVVIALGFLGYTYVVSPREVVMQIEAQSVEDGKIVMANPKLSGVTKDDRPYSMTALRAIQDFSRQTVIELEKIDARLPFDSDSWASVEAERGIYDSQANTLDLPNPISIRSDRGLVARLESAFIDVGKGEMTTTRPVEISLDGSQITSDSMQVVDNGKVLIFEKRVRVNIDPKRVRQVNSLEGDDNAPQ